MNKLYALFSSESNLRHSSINNGINTTEITPVMNVVEKIISIIAPFRCLCCGIDGKLVCTTCAVTNLVEFPSVCGVCDTKTEQFITCSTCRSSTYVDHIFAAYKYHTSAKDLVKALKFDRAQQAAFEIAEHLNAKLPAFEWDYVTFVPTAPKRARQRGYDQAELIARHFARLRGLQCKRLLFRVNNVRQVGSDRKTRLKQLEHAFLPARKVLNEHILIIDDVMSTGSSLQISAKVLREAGARRVDGAVFARS